MKIRIIIWALIVAYCSMAKAQERYMPHYTTADGLPSNTVYKVVKDERGFLWLATSNGICRFDGHRFETFSLKGLVNDVEFIDIFIGKQGRIWFIPFSGDILLYDGTKFQNGKAFFGRTFESVQQVIEDDFGNVWIAKQRADIYRYNLKSKRIINFKNKKNTFSYNNIVNIVSPNKVYVKSDLDFQEFYSNKTLFKLDPSINANRTRVICAVDSLKYIFPSDNGICFYNRGETTLTKVNKLPYQNTVFINLHQKLVCIGTSEDGLFLFNLIGDKLVYLSNELKGRSITYSDLDNEGNIWISTYNDGLYCMSPNPTFRLPNIGTYASEPLSIGKLNQQLLIGLNRGNLAVVEGNASKNIDFTQFYKDHYLTTRLKNIRIQPTGAWMSYENTLFQYNEKKIRSYIINGNIKDIALSDSLVFLATHHGIHASTLNQLAAWEIFPPFTLSKITFGFNANKDVRKLSFERTTAVAYNPLEKRLWAGTPNGLLTFNYQKINLILQTKNQIPQPSDQLPPVLQNFKYRITTLVILTDGTLVIGTSAAGIFFYKNNRLINLSSTEGLSNNFVQSLFLDDKKTLWACTINGLNKINFEGFVTKKWKITTYNTSNGLATNIVNDVFVKKDSIWVATSGGVTFLKDNIMSSKLPIPVHITNVWTDDSLVGINPYAVFESKNSIRFDFYAVSHQWGNNLFYRYRLINNSVFGTSNYKNWSRTNEHIVIFKKIMPGNYDLEVEAISKERGLLLGKTDLHFAITMPWHSNPIITGAIILFLVFAIMGVLFVYYYNQERKKRAFNEEFNELEKQAFRAQMNPHFVFNCLNAIQEFLMSNEPEQAQKYLSQFAKLIRKSLDFTKRSTVVLSDEIDFLYLYIKLEQMRYERPFKFEINISPEVKINEIEIPSLLFQPFVENAIRHGQLGRMHENGLLKLNFEVVQNYLQCTIDDNGIGLETSLSQKSKVEKEHISHGLGIVNKRIHLINQFSDKKNKVEIFDKKNFTPKLQGTCVFISLYIS